MPPAPRQTMPRPVSRERGARLGWAMLAVALVAFAPACRAPGSESSADSLQTEDVSAKPDARASLEGDAVAPPPPRAEALAGQLPAGFPREVPLPRPSSLVDFDARSVTLEVQGAMAGVRSAYERQLRDAGFASPSAGRWRKGGRVLAVSFEEHGGATRVRVEIPIGS